MSLRWLGLLLLAGVASAEVGYNIVQLSTAAPVGTEQAFLTQLQSQFNVQVIPNQFVPGTYRINVFGLNPGYTAPAPPPSTLEQALSLGATVYLYGWASGEAYDQHVDNTLVESYAVRCDTPIAGVASWDPETCRRILGAVDADIYQRALSTPTVVPGF